MIITPIKTDKITPGNKDLFQILDKFLPEIKEGSVLAITSKIVAICEGRVVKLDEVEKESLVEKEADLYLPASENKYGFNITIKNNIFIASAGVDESNGNGYYILWPKDPQESANKIREYLKIKFNLKNVGVVITDSKTTPLRWGVTGVALAHSGFNGLNNYIEKPDIFGRPMHVTKASIMDGLASAAVLVMGEGAEQTPIALIENLPFVEFQDRNPTNEELEMLKIELEDDIYSPILKNIDWKKGRG
jgi:dihydrofolate synthase / folylpolyglutamate synthase